MGGDEFDLDLGLKKKKKKKKPVDVSALENDLNILNLEGEEGEDANEVDVAEEVPGNFTFIANGGTEPFVVCGKCVSGSNWDETKSRLPLFLLILALTLNPNRENMKWHWTGFFVF